MFKSEKQSEHELTNTLKDFNQDYIHYSPNHHEILKHLFSNCSKTGDGIGLPDRIFFDLKTLIIFECKTNNLLQAEKDIEHYIHNLTDINYIIYGVAFISNNLYSIFKQENNKLIPLNNKLITLSTFNLIQTNETVDMKKEIHAVHNYIRDYTKISNEDKPFFIAIILISLSKTSFKYIFGKYENKEYLYDILLDNLKDYEIDISVFNFLRNDENNLCLHNLITMVYKLYQKNPSIDLLNEFYSEFVKYNNSDGKKLGIVLTPPHIVKLMCDMLEINKDDIVLDLCTGTGSFLLEASNSMPKKLIGVEYQNKLYALLKCNVILRELEDVIEIKKGNCFDFEYKATKSLINPPYGNKKEKEYDFILKQLDSLDEGGLACAIIPISKLTNNAQNNKYKKQIMYMSKVKKVIVCRKTLFYPYANVQCCIILLEKCSLGHSGDTNIINYEDDGFECKIHKGWVRNETFEKKYSFALTHTDMNIIDCNDNWHISNSSFDEYLLFESEFKLRALELEYENKRTEILNNDKPIVYNGKLFSLDDLFYVEKRPKIKYQKSKRVYMISAKNNNNGVKDIVDSNENTFTGNKLVLVTAGNGGAGLCFYQEEDFNIMSATAVLSPKTFKLNNKTGIFISKLLSKNKEKYSRHITWTITNIKNTKINLPINKNGEINYDYMESFVL